MTNPADMRQGGSEMAAIWSGKSQLQKMVEFEAALARAEARAEVIPNAAAEQIEAACRSWQPETERIQAVYKEAATAGTPAIPLVEMLRSRLEDPGRRYLHWGATSQDAMDTALVLQMREGLDLLVRRLFGIGEECAGLAERHRRTLMAGRTLLQQALPITFGLKAARWLGFAARQVRQLREARARVSFVQLGGATGTLASLGEAGVPVTEILAQELGLAVPVLPWHAERDRVAEVAAALGVVAGAMGKIATDLVLLAQTEVGEVAEAAGSGKGRSSALPQKRNPIDAIMALAASRRAIGEVPVILGAMVQEHERGAGGWQAEWGALPDLFTFTMDSVERVYSALVRLDVDTLRMHANLLSSHSMIMAESLAMALAPGIGRPEAYLIVQEAIERSRETGLDLRESALGDQRIRAALPGGALDRALDPASYLGSTDTYIDRALRDYHTLQHLPLEGSPHQ